MKNSVITCMYMHINVYLCIHTCTFVPPQVHYSHKHTCAHTQSRYLSYLMPVWSDGNFHPSLQLVLRQSANSKVAQPVKERGRAANTALTLQRRRSDLITSPSATQPVSPVSSREILFLSPSRVYKAASPALHIQGSFTHTHTQSSAALQLQATVPF